MKPNSISSIVHRSLLSSLLLPCILVIIIVMSYSASWMNSQLEQNTNFAVLSLARHIQAYTEDATSSLNNLAFKVNNHPENLERITSDFLDATPQFLRLIIINQDRRIEHSMPLGSQGEDFALSLNSELSSSQVLSRPFLSAATGQLVIYLGYKDKHGCIFAGELDLAQLQSHIQGLKPYPEGYIILTDAFGNLISHPNNLAVQRQENVGSLEYIKDSQAKPHTKLFHEDAGWSFKTGMRLAKLDWVLVASTPAMVILAPLLRYTLALPVLMLVLLFFVNLRVRMMLNKRVVKPLEQFTANIAKVKVGNYDALKLPQASCVSELAQAENEFASMANNVHAREVAIAEGAKRYQALFAAVSDPVAVFASESGLIVECNTEAMDFFGYSRKKLVGMSLCELTGQRGLPDESLAGCLARQIEKPEQPKEILIITSKNQSRLTSVKFNDFELNGLRYVLGVFHDITERKRAQEALLESEQRYRAIFEGSHAVKLLIDPASGEIADANPAACVFYGYSHDQLLRMRISDINTLPPDQLKTHLVKAQSNPFSRFEFTHRLASGEERRVEVDSGPMTLNGRKLLYSIVSDITERKRVEEALRKSEEQLVNAVRIAKLGHWEYDVVNGLFTFSDSFYAIFGTNAEEVGGYTMSTDEYSKRFVHPDDRFMVAEETAKAIASADPAFSRYVEHRCIHADGQVGYLAVHYYIVKDAAGRTVRTYGVNQDITERVRSEKALRESEIRFKALHNASFGGIAIHDKGIILDCNNGLSEMFGYSQEELIGMNGLLLIAENSRANVMSNILSGYEKPYEEYGLRKNGEEFPMRLEARNIPYRGKMVRVVEFRDITDVKNAANALLAARDAAEMANKTKSEFLANMSHEIRTPLNGILGMLQLIGTTSLDAEQKEFLFAAIKSSKRLTRLLSDILDLSKIEAGKLSLQESVFEINGLKRSVLDLFELTAEEQNIELEFLVCDGVPRKLLGDETRLRQILFNLVGNAIKFTPQGRVSVSAAPLALQDQSQLRILFTVSDTGIGIADELLESVFEPFTQAEGSYTRHFQGAGLGLSIVKKLVRMMGGELAIDNTEGSGTTIYLSLPFRLPEPGPGQVEKPSLNLKRRPHGLERVLLVDDDEVSLSTAKRMLEKFGYPVATAANGQEAIDLLDSMDFSLILMDVQMPVMDGMEATKLIRAGKAGIGKKNIPIIAITAYAMSGDKEKFMAAEINDYIAKPVEMADLEAVVRRVLDAGKTA